MWQSGGKRLGAGTPSRPAPPAAPAPSCLAAPPAHVNMVLVRPSFKCVACCAQVRELKTSNGSLVLLKTALGAGHFADSGLEARLREQAYK